MNTIVFSWINIQLTSSKQTTLNKQMSTHKNTFYKFLVINIIKF